MWRASILILKGSYLFIQLTTVATNPDVPSVKRGMVADSSKALNISFLHDASFPPRPVLGIQTIYTGAKECKAARQS